MLKKIIITLILIFSFFSSINYTFAWKASCSYLWGNISSAIDWCLSDSKLVDSSWNMAIEESFKDKLNDWIKKIGWFLGLIAIWAIVWGSFMMVISTGEEEKTKKAKDMIKWAILWFLWVVLASSLIALVVNFMYDLW